MNRRRRRRGRCDAPSTPARAPRRAWSSRSTASTPSARRARPTSRARPTKGGPARRRLRRRRLLRRLDGAPGSAAGCWPTSRRGKIDVVVVYKVDRLTRSLADFAKIVERLRRSGASFVSVTQAFNTTTSMGRLTLNVLLSFAQFEREVTGERIRDKIAASKAKGMWMGGNLPAGLRRGDRRRHGPGGQRGRGGAGPPHLPTLPGASLRQRAGALAGRERHSVQTPRDPPRPQDRRRPLQPRRALLPAEEPHLPWRDPAQGPQLSWRQSRHRRARDLRGGASAVGGEYPAPERATEARRRVGAQRSALRRQWRADVAYLRLWARWPALSLLCIRRASLGHGAREGRGRDTPGAGRGGRQRRARRVATTGPPSRRRGADASPGRTT